jgi:hypothetical protein
MNQVDEGFFSYNHSAQRIHCRPRSLTRYLYMLSIVHSLRDQLLPFLAVVHSVVCSVAHCIVRSVGRSFVCSLVCLFINSFVLHSVSRCIPNVYFCSQRSSNIVRKYVTAQQQIFRDLLQTPQAFAPILYMGKWIWYA